MGGVRKDEGASGRMTREWERKGSTKNIETNSLFISAGVNTARRAAAALTED